MSERFKFCAYKFLPPEQWRRPGKAEWANLLDLEMELSDALEMTETLVRKCRLAMARGEANVLMSISGELTPNPDDT